MESLLKIIGFIVLAVVVSVMGGYAVSVLWGWFVVPMFGAPVMGVPYAIGISVMLRYVAADTGKKDTTKEEVVHSAVMALAKPCVVLAIGYIVKQFI